MESIYTGKADFTAVIFKHTVTVTVADFKAKTFKDETLTVFTGDVKDVKKVIEKAVNKVITGATLTGVKTEKVLAVQTFETFMKNATFKEVPKNRQ